MTHGAFAKQLLCVRDLDRNHRPKGKAKSWSDVHGKTSMTVMEKFLKAKQHVEQSH